MAVGVGVSVAHAATPSILQVDDSSATCTDTGSGAGSPATPFCTIQAAVNATVAGGSVVIAPGAYVGAVDIKSSGTAAAPITIQISGVGPVRITDGAGQSGPALTFDGASYVNLYGDLPLASPWRSSAPGLSVASVLVNGSSHVTLDGFDMTSAAADFAVEMTGSSSDVSLLHSTLSGPHGGVLVAAGDSGDVISTNQITSQASGIEVAGAANTAITSNTLWGQSAAGHQIDVTTGATGTAIKDNLVAYPGTTAGTGAAISVDPTSAASTTEDYNLVWPDQQGTSTILEPAYSWAGTSYSSQAAFSQATSQGKHDLVADPQLQAGSPFTDHATAPEFNSADETATGWQTWDLYGHTCQGNPYVAITGNGPETDCERGAVQQAFEALAGQSTKAVGPLGVALTTSVTGETELEDSWISVEPAPTPAVSYVIDWGDGKTSAPIPGSVNIDTTTTHTYAKPGTYPIKETFNYTDTNDVRSSSFTTTALGAGILYQEERFADQHWSAPNTVAGSSGILQAAITGMPDESSQYVAVTAAGTLEHGVSSATGVWAGWGTLSQPGVTVTNASIAGMPNGTSQVVEVTSGGVLKHTIRNANGSWQSGWATPTGSTSITQTAITAMPNGDSQLVAVTTTGTLEHNIRSANGTWQGWGTPGQTDLVAAVADTGIAGLPNGDSQIVELSAN
jgi:hypothetical protein